MLCPTCKGGIVLAREEHAHSTIRTYRCGCGLYLTLEILEDYWRVLLREAGRVYGSVKEMGEPKEEESDG